MYKLSELIGKQAITLLDASSQGVILEVCFDKRLRKLRGFILLSDNDETICFVQYRHFCALSGDAAVIRSALDVCLNEEEYSERSPINLPAYNQDGKALGTIRDIIMDGAKVESFVTQSQEIPAHTLLSRSDSIVVFNDTDQPIKIRRPIKKQQSNEPPPVVESSPTSPQLPKVMAPSRVFSDRQNPAKMMGEMSKYYFLLGKRLKRSIYRSDGQLIAREDELITERLIQYAKENGKLVAIALHSL